MALRYPRSLNLPAWLVVGLGVLSAPAAARGGDSATLRELSTDRPDKTESPYTVDAGHFQLELDLINYTRDRDQSGAEDRRTSATSFAPVNVKYGLSQNVDLQLVFETYTNVRINDRMAGTVEHRSGFGDITARLKINCWGNDVGPSAFGAMPFVKFPTNHSGLGNDSVEGGVILPLALALPDGWGMGLMTEVDVVRNAADDGYDTAFINSITFSHDLAGRLDGYVELFTEISSARGADWIGLLGVGLTFRVSENLQWDAGLNVGLTDSADDLNPFVGISRRF